MSHPTMFPGATAVSRLTVYDWPSVDGLHGGTPHLHTASSEGYVVIAGRGRLQTLDRSGFAETVLVPGTLLWFTPGVVHRLVNDGGLELVVVMQNAGLPEAGDAVMTFPPEVLRDPRRYAQAQTLPDPEGSESDSSPAGIAARKRRDLALEGFLKLRERVVDSGPEALDELYENAAALVADRAEQWRQRWREGALAQANATGQHIDALERGQVDHLRAATIQRAPQAAGPRRFGMCGRLQVWRMDAAAHPQATL